MAPTSDSSSLLALAGELFGQTYLLVQHLKRNSIPEPSLEVGASTELWSSRSPDIENARSKLSGLSAKLMRLVYGPHEQLHEYVCSNWGFGALYTVLEFNILEKIPLDGQAEVTELADQSGIPKDKLLNILRLVACEDILKEVSSETFQHTAISELLVTDENFKAFIGFQLFETRIASAHLADSLKRSNGYWSGPSGFKHAWGSSMYDWHKAHPDKGARFQKGMQSVAQLLDPGNTLFRDWYKRNESNGLRVIVDLAGKSGATSKMLAEQFPELQFEVQETSATLVAQGEQTLSPELQNRIKFVRKDMFTPQPVENAHQGVLAYMVWSVLWNMTDNECINLIRGVVPELKKSPQTVLLINELMSPAHGSFDSQLEKAYRRRDVTLMTMHNAKSRTEEDWMKIFVAASPDIKISVDKGFTSHNCRGLWELRWDGSE